MENGTPFIHHDDGARADGDGRWASEGARSGAGTGPGPPPVLEGFRTERLLGTGGSSSVWLVAAEDGGRPFALKIPLDGTPEADAAGSFREVDLLAGFQHDHLLVIHGPVATSRGTGIRMDYAPGGSLQNLLGVRGPLPVGEAVTVLAPIAQALAYLHAHGATHGDVAPGNILFTEEGKPLLGDFGLGRRLGEGGRPAAGTPGFMASRGPGPGRLDTGADVFALAAVAWFVLTGRVPGPSVQRPPLSVLVPEVPLRFLELVEEGLSEDPGRRPDAASFASGLLRAVTPVPVDLVDAVDESVRPVLRTRSAVPAGRRARRGVLWLRLSGWARLGGWAGPGEVAWLKVLARPKGWEAPRVRRRRPGRPDAAAGPRGTPADGRLPVSTHAPRGRRARIPPANTGRIRGRAAALAVLLVLAGGSVWVGAVDGEPVATGTSPARSTSAGPGTPAPQTRDRTTPDRTTPDRSTSDRWTPNQSTPDQGTTSPESPGPVPQDPAPGPVPQTPVPQDPATPTPEDSGPGAAFTEAAKALPALAALRAEAYATADPSLLGRVNTDGSPAMESDAAGVATLAAAGGRLAGLRITIVDPRPVDPADLPALLPPDGSGVRTQTVAATAEVSAHTETDSAGAAVSARAEPRRQELVFVLRDDGLGWRIQSVHDTP